MPRTTPAHRRHARTVRGLSEARRAVKACRRMPALYEAWRAFTDPWVGTRFYVQRVTQWDPATPGTVALGLEGEAAQ